MFLLDEEVPAHVTEHEEARAKPAIRSMTPRTYQTTFVRLSSSCPSKPIVGSLPTPELHKDMPLLSLPNTPASHDDGAKIISSLFTGCRVNEHSRKVRCPYLFFFS